VMKRVVEQYFEGRSRFKVFRLSYVFSWSDKFMEYLHHSFREGKKIEVFPFYRKMIYLGDVLGCIESLINQWDDIEQSVFNICGTELVSRLDLAQLYDSIVGRIDYELVDPPEDFFLARAQTIFVNSTTVKMLLGREALSMKEAMELEKSNIK